MGEIDQRNKLDEQVFSYRVTKDRKVFLYWHDRHVKTLTGKESDKFLSRIEGAGEKDAQLIMAKVTGNFKRGNEKDNK